MHRKLKFRIIFLVFLIIFIFSTQAQFFKYSEEFTNINQYADVEIEKHYSRNLLSERITNCTPASIDQFPDDLFTIEQRKYGAILLHIFACLYSFIGLSLVCDDYFVPSLESISEALHLRSDVAGATFMAAGTSAPELAATIIGVFIAKDDVGLAAVVGSAVFNLLFVIGFCAVGAGTIVYLEKWPLFRDCSFYTVSIGVLVAVIYDGRVYWYESVLLLCLYLVYIFIMYWNETINSWLNRKSRKEKLLEEINIGDEEEDTEETDILLVPGKDDIEADKDSEDDDKHILAPPNHKLKLCWWILTVPISCLLYITVPDCRKKRWKKCFTVTFIMSVVWIGIYSYLLMWMITVIGYTFHIPDTIMAIIFLAFGVSMPDAIASWIVVKNGLGDMAVSNAVGSNVFDILLCLGLPWTLKICISKNWDPVIVYSRGLTYSSITLLTTVVLLIGSVHLNGWKLNKKLGFSLLCLYVTYIIIASLYELNIFAQVHPPTCS
ncbi:DgyrCDS9893 [Dimorphilus gyrociliatus]|uniref:DgyrCDS9893 n=1 Tax=Dimorphilus gyrociliatus TaxID=2664684 RepID=A0A7I8W003_9ANNE|nr:DgyrCDS9893 [Dimorphilus gyrociliatus]